MSLNHRFAVAVIAGLVSLSAPAWAQGQGMGMGMGPAGMGPGMMRGPMLPDPAALTALKAKLRLTPAQEGAWASYAEGVTAANDMRRQMQGAAREMPPADRMASRGERQAAGAQVHDEINTRREALSQVLSPEQRQILDREAPPLPPPPRH